MTKLRYPEKKYLSKYDLSQEFFENLTEDEKSILEKKVSELRVTEESIISDYAKTQDVVKQIIDLSLLQSNLLRGENLSKFIRRSYSMM